MRLDSDYYVSLLRRVCGGLRPLVIGGGPVVAQVPLARELRAVGADRPLLLGSSIGLGVLPDPDEAEWHSLELESPDFLSAIHDYEATLLDLPGCARKVIDRWDPERRAVALGTIVLSDLPQVAGRRRYARRAPEWLALEDKTKLPAFLDAIGVRRGPLAVVAAEPGALRGAAARLDRGRGTVWAGDARDGVDGGASHVRWVRCADSAREAHAFFAAHCDRVRVQPFLEGIPCSVHGLVTGQGVAIFRPVETLTFRRAEGGQLVYAGSASFWDPNSRDREEIRSVARRIGRGLAERLDYRGAFTLDGVLAEEGFVPTEINPRVGAAFRLIAAAWPELPLHALALAAQHGEALDYRPAELERELLERAESRRSGGGGLVVARRLAATEARSVVALCDGYRTARSGEAPDAWISLGPSAGGGFAIVRPDPERTRTGPSIAPRVAQGYAYADREFGTDIGPLIAAEPVR